MTGFCPPKSRYFSMGCINYWSCMCLSWLNMSVDLIVLDWLHICACCIGLFICGPVASSVCVCVCVCWVDCSWVCLLDLYWVNNSLCVCWLDCPRVCLWLWLFRYVSVRLLIDMCVFWSECPCTFLLDWNSRILVCGVDFSCVCLLCFSFIHVHVPWLSMPLSVWLTIHPVDAWVCQMDLHTCVNWFVHSCVCLLDWSYMCVSVGLTLHECVCWVGSVHVLRLFYYHILSVS